MDKEQTDKEFSAEDLKNQLQVRLGQRLCTARKRKEMTIAGVSSTLKIHKTFLEGLEKGDWRQLPDDVYALGFLRQYATLLGEDIHEDVEILRSGDYQLTKPFTIPDPPIAPSKMWAMITGILFVLLFILFNTMHDGENETSPPASSSTDIQVISAGKNTVKSVPPKEISKMKAPLPAQASGTSPSPVHASINTDAAVLHQTQLQTLPPSSSTSQNIPGMHHYRLMAVNASVWLQLHDPSGILIKEVLLHPGQSLLLKSSEPFLSLTCGNAAALKIEVDGILYAAAGSLGEPEKVLHDFRIDISNHGEQTTSQDNKRL